jgi:tetratricopeptide (TPR) repeat protein
MNVTRAPARPGDDPNTIRAFDPYGREILVAAEEWRTRVLPGALKAAWDDPELLSGLIVGAVNDGFASDALDAAEHLHRIDPNPARAVCVHGIVLMKTGQLDRAEQVLQSFLDANGDDGAVLTNLAKVFAERKHVDKAERTLARALDVDPNQDNALLWQMAIQRERGGSGAARQALERVAALPASWLAELWLASLALERRELTEALAYYDESLATAGAETPTHVLMQMSGDLGKAGHLVELLRLTVPRFRPERHGLVVGNNLIKAHIDLRQHDEAAGIVDALYALKRPEWSDTLGHWERELAKARAAQATVAGPASAERVAIAIEAPIWLPSTSPASMLFRKPAPVGPTIHFVGSTVEMSARLARQGQGFADPGRLSRALPLFLAEQVDMSTGAACVALVPWRKTAPIGFAVTGTPWTDDDALRVSTASDYVVVTHLTALTRQWSARARVLRRADAARIGETTVLFDATGHDMAMFSLGRQVVDMLRGAGVVTGPPPPAYVVPMPLADYFVRLEQLLALRCTPTNDSERAFLSGEREILAGNLRLCLDAPHSFPARLLLAETVASMRALRPQAVDEFAERLAALQAERPLAEAEQRAVEQVLAGSATSNELH